MKIAISSTGKEPTDRVSDVFARCPYFVFADIEEGEIKKIEIIENKVAGQLSRAGISAAQLIVEKNVKAVILKNIGPRAFDVLNRFKIDVYIGEETIEKVLEKFIEGKLKKNKSK